VSADNGCYCSRWIAKDGSYEYRVAHAQAIENCDYGELADAYRVLYFSSSEVYDNRKEALDEAIRLYDDLPICEYGICEIDYDVPFPFMTYREAEEVLDTYWKDFMKQKKEKYA
jgi:hypothetical protein